MMRKHCRSGFKTIFMFMLLPGLLMMGACAPSFHARIDYKYSGQLIWPGEPEKPRIKYLWSLYSFMPEGKRIEDYLLGTVADPENIASTPYLLRPYGVFVDTNNKLYIVDKGAARVSIIDLSTNEVKHFGYDGKGQLLMPIDVSVDASGKIYVTDSDARKVFIYNPEGKFAGYLIGDAEFGRPTGIAIDGTTGHIYVVDTATHRINVFDNNGKPAFSFGERGGDDGELNYPTHIAIGPGGNILVTDAMNFRVQIFDSKGNFITKFGKLGSAYDDLERPKGVAADTFGNIYVADAAQNMIKIFDRKGRLLMFFGETGRTPGRFTFPSGIFIDTKNKIYVADTYNMRIQVFELIGSEVL